MKKNKKKELLFSVRKEDFDIQTFKSGGKGGQHQNTCDSGVRIVHRESNAVGESRTSRSQHRNKILAHQRLVKTPKFKLWINKKAFEVMKGKTFEQEIDDMLTPENLKIEIKDKNNNWVVWMP